MKPADGTLACWGGNGYGQATPPSGEFLEVAAGGYFTCGLRTDGRVRCWGDRSLAATTPPDLVFAR
jgi:hypothetical protein